MLRPSESDDKKVAIHVTLSFLSLTCWKSLAAWRFPTDYDVPATRSPLKITQPAYFNLDGSDDILQHEMWIDSDAVLPIDNKLIPVGKLTMFVNPQVKSCSFLPF
ncbi:hypothetical protein [Photobacterium sp. DNB22_13_2]